MNESGDGEEGVDVARSRDRLAIVSKLGRYGINFLFWRPVIQEVATPTEVMAWPFLRFFECHVVLDVKDELTEYNQKAAIEDAKEP